ncbi:hypothetical protein B0J11DRAFT_571837 [Dendryphion nanum]|uniref:Uncharacterized protein n=1 Tax=Dendryphion nanum TaxID=256645 RepID=A0A9P9ICT6_9PLEO|nr:hypothetical protein B0J11DRAFT_571837 [Dendryphion nanum]
MLLLSRQLLALVGLAATVFHVVGAMPETVTSGPTAAPVATSTAVLTTTLTGCVTSSVATHLTIAPTIPDDAAFAAFTNSLSSRFGQKSEPRRYDAPVNVYYIDSYVSFMSSTMRLTMQYASSFLASAGVSVVTASNIVLFPCASGLPTPSGCTPHDDHWHCADGVPVPTYPPGVAACPPAPSGCTPHEDHWHCDKGVPYPTYTPAPCQGEGHGNSTITHGHPSKTAKPSGAASNLNPQAPSFAAFMLSIFGIFGFL